MKVGLDGAEGYNGKGDGRVKEEEREREEVRAKYRVQKKIQSDQQLSMRASELWRAVLYFGELGST